MKVEGGGHYLRAVYDGACAVFHQMALFPFSLTLHPWQKKYTHLPLYDMK